MDRSLWSCILWSGQIIIYYTQGPICLRWVSFTAMGFMASTLLWSNKIIGWMVRGKAITFMEQYDIYEVERARLCFLNKHCDMKPSGFGVLLISSPADVRDYCDEIVRVRMYTMSSTVSKIVHAYDYGCVALWVRATLHTYSMA